MKNTIKKIVLVSILGVTALNANMFSKFEQEQTQEEVQRIQNGGQPKIQKKLLQIDQGVIDGAVNRIKTGKGAPTTISQEEYDKQTKNAFLQEQIKRKELIIKELKGKMEFVKSEKKIKLKSKQKYIDLFIPFNKLSVIKFDQRIKDLRYLKTETIAIKNNQDDQKLEIINKDPNLELQLNIVLLDGTELVVTLKVGNNSAQRHIEHSLFTNGTSLAAKALFLKQTNVKRIHNDFNNKAMLMIFARVTKNNLYRSLRENIVHINKDLFNGTTEIETLYGLKPISYRLHLNNVYESPFIKADKKDPRYLRKLALMELTLTNNNQKEVLRVNETLVKNTFGNYVAMYLGDLERGENVLAPGGSLRFLVVIEDKVKK